MAEKNDDFLAALQARRVHIQKQRAQQPARVPEPEVETEPQAECMRPGPAPAPESKSEPAQQIKDPRPAEPESVPVAEDQPEAWSVRLSAAEAAATEAGAPMRVAGGWSDLGGNATATVRDLESRLLTAPEQASAAAHTACEKIVSPVLDELETRVEAVVMAWLSVLESDWGPLFAEAQFVDVTWQSAAYLLNEALCPATAQAQSVVDEVGGLAGRIATSHPDLADQWKELAWDLRGRHAAIADTAGEIGRPGSAAHMDARARAQAHAWLSAMSPDERRRAGREAVIKRMSPSDAAAARAADAAAAAAAAEQAAAAAAVSEWRTVAADLTQRYPLARSIIACGHRPMSELLRTAGLGKKLATARKNSDGSTTKVVSEELPTLASIVEVEDGIEFEFDPLPGQSVATWQAALGVLGVELGMTTLTIEQRGRRIVVATHDVTRPEMPKVLIRDRLMPYDAAAGRSYLGMTEAGEDAYITWADGCGLVVGGVPGSGKTASLLPVFAGMAGHAELHVFDGKAGFDLEPLRPISRTFDNSGDIDGPLASVLERIEQLRVTRAGAIYTRTGISNFWNVPAVARAEMGLFPVVVVIDECQTWLDTSGMDKEEREYAAVITRGIRSLVQKGRAAGITVILTTQKPDAKSIPTVIRDNSGLKVSFRVTTREQGVAVLGALEEGAPRPTEIPRSAKGRCITTTEEGVTTVVQAIYVDPRDIAAALAGARPVPDQLVVARGL